MKGNVYRQWSTVPDGTDAETANTDYGLRESAHVDPDSNLHRYRPVL